MCQFTSIAITDLNVSFLLDNFSQHDQLEWHKKCNSRATSGATLFPQVALLQPVTSQIIGRYPREICPIAAGGITREKGER